MTYFDKIEFPKNYRKIPKISKTCILKIWRINNYYFPTSAINSIRSKSTSSKILVVCSQNHFFCFFLRFWIPIILVLVVWIRLFFCYIDKLFFAEDDVVRRRVDETFDSVFLRQVKNCCCSGDIYWKFYKNNFLQFFSKKYHKILDFSFFFRLKLQNTDLFYSNSHRADNCQSFQRLQYEK